MRNALHLVHALALFAPYAIAAPTVTIKDGTVVGSSAGGIDTFLGVPFAQPPTGNLRLRPPQSLAAPFGTLTATSTPTACATYTPSIELFPLPADVQSAIDTAVAPFTSIVAGLSAPMGEDCLNLNIQRPSNTTASSKLPVLVYIHGGGFESGSNMIDASAWLADAQDLGAPFVHVSINYRLSAFGFLAGKELSADGSTNLGLRDQRLALQWVQDNITPFGGDPSRVTIFGESAGSISVLDHLIINSGNNTYNSRPLFSQAIMNSGLALPTLPVTHPKPQSVFDAFVSATNCTNTSTEEKLSCLRSLPYSSFLEAQTTVGQSLYRSLDATYIPRPDPSSSFFPISPELALRSGSFARVPMIAFDDEDEGTIFSLAQNNLTTTEDLVEYFTSWWPNSSNEIVTQLINTYPPDPAEGSPFRTGELNQVYQGYKRVAAVIGDVVFTLSRRLSLSLMLTSPSPPPIYSALGTWWHNLIPFLGTFHGSDVFALYNGLATGDAASQMRRRYTSFITYQNPNTLVNDGGVQWPKYDLASKQILVFAGLDGGIFVQGDMFRQESYESYKANVTAFRQ